MQPDHSAKISGTTLGDGVSNYRGTRFGVEGSFGIGTYRNEAVCYGEAPARLEGYLHNLNERGAQRSIEWLHIDPGATLTLVGGNPVQLGFTARGSEHELEIRFDRKGVLISRIYLSRDPATRKVHYSEETFHSEPLQDLAVVNCLVGARIAFLLWGSALESRPDEASRGSADAWRYLIKRGVAESIASGEYRVKEEVAASEASAALLRSLLKQEFKREMRMQSPLYHLDGASFGEPMHGEGRLGVELWLETSS